MKTKKELLTLAKELEDIKGIREWHYGSPEYFIFQTKFEEFEFELGFPTTTFQGNVTNRHTLELKPLHGVCQEAKVFINRYFGCASDNNWCSEAKKICIYLKENKYTEIVELLYDAKKEWNKENEVIKAEIPYSLYKDKYWKYEKVENSYNAEKKTIKIYISKKKYDEDRKAEARTVIAEVPYYDYRHKYYSCKTVKDSYDKSKKTIKIYIDSKRLEEKL